MTPIGIEFAMKIKFLSQGKIIHYASISGMKKKL